MKHLENTYKDWFSSLLGSASMAYAGYGWHSDWLTSKEAGIVAFIGFVLLFLRTRLTQVIGDGLGRVFDAAMRKIFGGNNPPPPAVMIVLLALASFSIHAQNKPINTSEIRLIHKNDSLGIVGVGQIRWDQNTGKFRFWNGSNWFSYGTGSGVTASNGLTKVGNDIQLGGDLTSNTTITSVGNFSLALGDGIDDPSSFGVTSLNYNVLNGGGIIYQQNVGASGTGVFTGKHIFSPTLTNAGLNIGGVAGNPSSLTDGDVWLNTNGGGFFMARYAGQSHPIMLGTILTNRINYGSGLNGVVSNEAGFEYDEDTNLMTVPNVLIGEGSLELSSGLGVNDFFSSGSGANSSLSITAKSSGVGGSAYFGLGPTAGPPTIAFVEVLSDNGIRLFSDNVTTSHTDGLWTNAEPLLNIRYTRNDLFSPSVGIGAGLGFEVETSNNNVETGATILAITTDITATSEDFDLTFNTMAAGAAVAERLRISSVGAIGIGGANYGTSGQVLTSNGSGSAPSWSNAPTESNWTPTFTGVSNVASSTNIITHQYVRVGNKVICYGGVSVTPTASATLTEIRITLPIASAMTSSAHLTGTVTGEVSTVGFQSGNVVADATNDEGVIRFYSNTTSAHVLKYSFMYMIL